MLAQARQRPLHSRTMTIVSKTALIGEMCFYLVFFHQKKASLYLSHVGGFNYRRREFPYPDYWTSLFIAEISPVTLHRSPGLQVLTFRRLPAKFQQWLVANSNLITVAKPRLNLTGFPCVPKRTSSAALLTC